MLRVEPMEMVIRETKWLGDWNFESCPLTSGEGLSSIKKKKKKTLEQGDLMSFQVVNEPLCQEVNIPQL